MRQFLEIEGYKVQNILDGKDRNLSNVKIEKLRVQITGPDFDNSDKIISKNSILTLSNEGSAIEKLNNAGLTVIMENNRVIVEEPFPGTALFQELQDFDFYADRPVLLETVLIEVSDRPFKSFCMVILFITEIIIG